GPKLADVGNIDNGTNSQSIPEMGGDRIFMDLEIATLKARIKNLEDRDRGDDDPSREDATIKGRSLETGEEAGIERSIDKGSNDTEEMVNVLTSLDAASVLSSGVQVSVPPAAEVPTVSIPPAGEVPTGSSMVPTGSSVVSTASPIFTTAIVATPYTRRKVLKSHAGWKAKHFKGMTLEEIRETFDPVWKQIQDFVPMGSKKEGERFKRKGLSLEQDSAKKHFDREDLNQLWELVKKTLNIRQATSNKEKELWVELKRLYEPDVEDQLWTQTQALMHDPVEWRLYDSYGVHHILLRD
nr:hypothetical protein [Tanacetum cinerariifolium]